MRSNIETLPIDRILREQFFSGKIMQNVYQSLVQNPVFNLVYSQKQPIQVFLKHSLFSWKLLEKGPWTKDLIISLFWSPQIDWEIVFCQILPYG